MVPTCTLRQRVLLPLDGAQDFLTTRASAPARNKKSRGCETVRAPRRLAPRGAWSRVGRPARTRSRRSLHWGSRCPHLRPPPAPGPAAPRGEQEWAPAGLGRGGPRAGSPRGENWGADGSLGPAPSSPFLRLGLPPRPGSLCKSGAGAGVIAVLIVQRNRLQGEVYLTWCVRGVHTHRPAGSRSPRRWAGDSDGLQTQHHPGSPGAQGRPGAGRKTAAWGPGSALSLLCQVHRASTPSRDSGWR